MKISQYKIKYCSGLIRKTEESRLSVEMISISFMLHSSRDGQVQLQQFQLLHLHRKNKENTRDSK